MMLTDNWLSQALEAPSSDHSTSVQ
ncbi:hypothetical protein TNCV_3825961, partial [Trichonephila clavipes]